MKILFFISHQPNPRFVKQLNFLDKTNQVSLVFFERKTLANLNKSISSTVVMHNLGDIPNASEPIKRIKIYAKVISKLKKIITTTNFDIVLVNNIDVLVLYLFAKRKFTKIKPKLAIEISDLREFVFSKSTFSSIMRKIEKTLYKKYIDKLIVTSKKYYSYHFQKFYNKEVFVLENKLLASDINNKEVKTTKSSKKTIIGIVGLLLRKDEYIKLFETYKNNPTVEIHIHGKGHYQNIVEKYATEYENIIYFGPYNAFNDAQKIYASLDIIYLVYDTNQVSLNNKLALPNKLYECMYYKVPIICSKDTYLAEIVSKLKIGETIDYLQEGAISKSVTKIIENRSQTKTLFDKLPKNLYFGDADYEALEQFLSKK